MRKMTEMTEIEEAKKQFIKALLKKWCDKYQKGNNYGVMQMKELLRLTDHAGLGIPIPQADWPREMKWGVGRWWRYSTGVLDRQNDGEGHVSYWIRKEFYTPVKQALIEYDHEHTSMG